MAENKIQMSDSLLVAMLLTISGGFLDAYTYIVRGGVFSNAQTGNIVLFGISLFEKNFVESIDYLMPILAFIFGILIADTIKDHFHDRRAFHWRQFVLVIELIVLAAAAFMPNSCDVYVNTLISFVCALQVESFRKVMGSPFATTMCTGNLRSATAQLYKFHKERDRDALTSSLRYFFIISLFAAGAGIGAILSRIFFRLAVLFAGAPILAVTFILAKSPDTPAGKYLG